MSPAVLVVEDNDDNIKLMSYLLEAGNHRAIVARNGAEGVEMAFSEQPDLILMDLQMPVMDGYEALAEIRKRGLADVPIVAVTAMAMVGDRDRVIASGFDGYIAKPITADSFVQEVEEHLR